MSECKVILITSCKGGIGKSTVSANLAMSLAKRGKRTLLVDLDLSNRSLDLILGLEDNVVFDVSDVVNGRKALSDAVLLDARCGLLYFLAAPAFYEDKMEADAFAAFIKGAREEYECIVMDTPGSVGEAITLAAADADTAIIVASHQPTSQRAAEKTDITLEGLGVKERYLVINGFDTDAVLSGTRPGIIEIIDKTKIQIIGVIPYSRPLAISQEDGLLSCERKKLETTAAFDNVAARLMGESIPLLSGVSGRRRRKLILA